MDAGGFFRGTSAEQDNRFSNKERKLIESTAFPTEFEKKVDMKKVKLDTIKPWIAKQVTEILKFEDDVLINYIYGLLEEKEIPCPKTLQISITGFLDEHSAQFMKELWILLLSAQDNLGGIPTEFLEEKKREIRKKKEEHDKINAEVQRSREKVERELQIREKKKIEAANKEHQTHLENTAPILGASISNHPQAPAIFEESKTSTRIPVRQTEKEKQDQERDRNKGKEKFRERESEKDRERERERERERDRDTRDKEKVRHRDDRDRSRHNRDNYDRKEKRQGRQGTRKRQRKNS